MIEHIKMMQNTLSQDTANAGKVPHVSNSGHLFWNLKHPLLVQKLSYYRRMTYHSLCIGFFHQLVLV